MKVILCLAALLSVAFCAALTEDEKRALLFGDHQIDIAHLAQTLFNALGGNNLVNMDALEAKCHTQIGIIDTVTHICHQVRQKAEELLHRAG